MNIHKYGGSLAVALLAVAAACGPSAETRRATDSVVATANHEKVASQAGEVMGTRREAQSYLDEARAAFVAKNTGAAANSLKDAATFTRAQADSIAEPARTTLMASSAELTELATRVAKNGVSNVKTLDYAFARTQVAEAQLHCVRGLEAWKTANAGATSAEITMLVDHFERAVADAGKAPSASARQAVATARLVADKLAKGTTVPSADVEGALSAMDKEVHEFLTSIANLKG